MNLDLKTTLSGLCAGIVGALVYFQVIDEKTGVGVLGLVGTLIGFFACDAK